MTILVTGGAGYLGSMLTTVLLQRGYNVRVLDNLMYGDEPLRGLESWSSFELIKGDIRDMRTVVKALSGVDEVIHLASIVGDQAAGLEARSTIEINYLATRNLAELCNLYNVKRILYASTCSVYGESKEGMIMDESDSLEGGEGKAGPISLYGETKLRSEKTIASLCDNATILRLGTLFGLSRRMRFDLAINLFLARALSGHKITVFGGQQYRPFLHVLDAADAFMHTLENDLKGVFNVAWRNLKLIDAAMEIRKKAQVEVKVSKEIVDRRNYLVNCDKINKTGFRPLRDIEFAMEEISKAFADGTIVDYTLPKYSNYKLLFESEEVQRKVYTLGPIGEQLPRGKNRSEARTPTNKNSWE